MTAGEFLSQTVRVLLPEELQHHFGHGPRELRLDWYGECRSIRAARCREDKAAGGMM